MNALPFEYFRYSKKLYLLPTLQFWLDFVETPRWGVEMGGGAENKQLIETNIMIRFNEMHMVLL